MLRKPEGGSQSNGNEDANLPSQAIRESKVQARVLSDRKEQYSL
jgi:hypothetical protein